MFQGTTEQLLNALVYMRDRKSTGRTDRVVLEEAIRVITSGDSL